jgi:hypothetical protein
MKEPPRSRAAIIASRSFCVFLTLALFVFILPGFGGARDESFEELLKAIIGGILCILLITFPLVLVFLGNAIFRKVGWGLLILIFLLTFLV